MSEISRVNHQVKSGRATRSLTVPRPIGAAAPVPAGCCIQHSRDNAHVEDFVKDTRLTHQKCAGVEAVGGTCQPV